MKIYFYKIFLPFIFLFGFQPITFSQNNNLDYLVELSTNFSSQETLPFWLTTNKYGAVPNSNNGILSAGLFQDFKPHLETNKIDFSFGAQLTGAIPTENKLIVSQLYGSVKWKKLQLDVGVKHKEVLFEGLSSSNGDFSFSTNARSIPGINLKLIDFVKLPFAKKWLTIKGNFGEYLLNDNRVVDNARIHHKSLYFKSQLNKSLELITGISHYAMWSGNSQEYGKQPSSFKDYLKVVTGRSGGGNSTINDQLNGLGNHLGNYLIQLNKKGEKTDWSFYWSHPFEDRSGRELRNLPDGIYGLYLNLKNTKQNSLLFEFHYTKDQGAKASDFNFIDNYFNNSIYQSGWTYQGNTIGNPFFPTGINEEGDVKIDLLYNRFISYHIGFNGTINSNISYKTLLSYVSYSGRFNSTIENKPKLFASLIEVNYIKKTLPFKLSLGLSTDFGDFRIKNNIGGFIKIIKTGKF